MCPLFLPSKKSSFYFSFYLFICFILCFFIILSMEPRRGIYVVFFWKKDHKFFFLMFLQKFSSMVTIRHCLFILFTAKRQIYQEKGTCSIYLILCALVQKKLILLLLYCLVIFRITLPFLIFFKIK